MTTKVLAEPSLVSREHELEELRIQLESVKSGKGATVFVCGEAGAGKTRLVFEFLKEAKKQGFEVLSGWCLSNAAIPYFPFFEAFREYFANEHEPREVELKNWLMGPPQLEKYGDPRIVTPQVWKDQTFTAVANTVASISTNQPLILCIDDLHWADSASLALINYLAYTIKSEKILILATYRIEQINADVEGRPHPLAETLRQMRRQDLIKEINVNSLNEAGVWQLATNMLGGNVQERLAKNLTEESQGNPLFVVESLRMLYESNGLIEQDKQWRLTNNAIGIPPKIKDIILQRLGALSRGQRSLLDAASVIGEKFDPLLLATVLGQDELEVVKTLDAVAKDTSLIHCEGALYRFDHARTRDAIYGDTSLALKRSYHAKVAQSLESKSEKLSLNDLAYHFAQGENIDKAVKYALAAGQDALAKWSNEEAIKQFMFVVLTIGENPRQTQMRLVALEGLGDAYYANNNFQQAITTFQQVADSADDSVKLRVLRKALQASFYQGDVTLQKALVLKAEAVTGADRLEAARFLHEKSSAFMSATDWAGTGKIWQEVLQVFDEEYALADAANILLWLGYGQACIGDLEKGVAFALRSVAIFDELQDYRSQMEAYAYAGGTFQASMLIDNSNAMIAKAIEVNERYKIWDYVRLFPAYVWEAVNLIGVDTQGLIKKALQALEYFKKTDSYLYAGAVHGVLMIANGLAGDIERVKEYYAKFTNLPQYILSNAPTQVYLGPTMLTYYAAIGEFDKAEKCFNDWQDVVKTSFPGPFMNASARQLYAWALGKQGRFAEAKDQLDEAQRITIAAQNRFSHVNIVPSLMMLTRPSANQNIPVRLDLVNASLKEGLITEVANLPEATKILGVSPNCIVKEGQLYFRDKTIKPFEVKTIKLTIKPPKTAEEDSFRLSPKISYIDDLGQTKTCSPNPVTVTVQRLIKNNARAQEAVPAETSDEIDILKKFGLKSKLN
jgi:tetratricopeptide (TPR) repeat protein